MSRGKRVPKTLRRKLADLDDHLYLLEDALSRLAGGEVAHLKTLAAELRVLVCKSSGTEGLLWRLAEELGTNDAVHVHLAGSVKQNHPLAGGLDFAFVPVVRAGNGDPRITPQHCPLKAVIKEEDAVFVSGRGYTHEDLIKAVAQQMGSAHEDEGVEPDLVRLGTTQLGNCVVLTQVLCSDADLVLEVGGRVLAEAEQSLGFSRRERARLKLRQPPSQQAQPVERTDFEAEVTQLPREGSVAFLVDHPHPDWRTNGNCYRFGEVTHGPLSISSAKLSDCTMEITIRGLLDRPVSTRSRMPVGSQPGAMIAVTWTDTQLDVYINGQLVDTIPVGDQA